MIENYPLVSVIIPVYNCERFVEQALRSIMEQTYKNLEIIVTDDCSTDRTYEILQRLALEDTRIKLIKNKRNLKIVKTLNNMLDIVQGKYIARMDADDISLSERIAKQVDFMETHPDYAICGTNAYLINENNKLFDESILPNSNDEITFFRKFKCPFFHPTVVIKSEILKFQKYDEKFQFAEDLELWQRILDKNMGYNLKEKLFCYRVINSSISRNAETAMRQKEITSKILGSHVVGAKEKSIRFCLYIYIKRHNEEINFVELFIYYTMRFFMKLHVLLISNKLPALMI